MEGARGNVGVRFDIVALDAHSARIFVRDFDVEGDFDTRSDVLGELKVMSLRVLRL